MRKKATKNANTASPAPTRKMTWNALRYAGIKTSRMADACCGGKVERYRFGLATRDLDSSKVRP